MADANRIVEILTDTGYKVASSAVIGAITAVFAYLLTTLSEWIFSQWSHHRADAIFALPSTEWLLWSFGALVIGGLIVTGLLLLVPGGKVTGPPDTLHSLADPDFRVNPRTGIVSTAIATLTTGFGGSVGLYGPLIHFGSLVADLVRRVVRSDRISYSTFVACGVASAISSVFLAPIGAALFATEFIVRRMNLRDFLPISISSTSAYLVALTLQRQPTFHLDQMAFDLNITNLAVTILLGLAIGLVTIAFTRSIEIFNAAAQRYIPLKTFSPLSAALVVFCIGAFFPDVLGTGVPFIQRAFTETQPTAFLALLLVAKFFATGICVAGRFYGGIFAPSLFIGAITGAILANLLLAAGLGTAENIREALAVFPVISAFAVASAMVGEPFAAAIIVLEMTQSYEVASLGFATCVIATYVYSAFMGRSFFDRRLHDRGVHYEDSAPVRQVKTTAILSLAAPMPEIEVQVTQYDTDLENVSARTDAGDDDSAAGGEPNLALQSNTSVFDAIREMDERRVRIAEVIPPDEDAPAPADRRYVLRDRIFEYAWNLTLADSESCSLGTLQTRDFTPLTESDLTRDLNATELNLIRTLARTRMVKQGEQLIAMGDSSRSFYVLNAGVAHVSRKLRDREDAVLVAYLYAGNVFGEISFMTGEPRTANVTAVTDCIVQEFSVDDLGERREDMPRIYASLEKLAAKRKIRIARQKLRAMSRR